MWLCMVAYACDSMGMCVEFRKEILLKGKECKTWEKNSIFLKRGKTVILVENQNFSRSWMIKHTSPLESSSEILLPSRISSNSKKVRISCFSRHRV